MKVDIIIGANLGDEGKGTVTATCTKHSESKVLNVLTNGGSQRAHSILTDIGNITFQHFGSGSYYEADTFLSKYFILNPMTFIAEYSKLLKYNVIPKVYRDINCRWSTPFDMLANRIIETLRENNSHGSCGMGIWETIVRYNNTAFNVPFDSFNCFEYSDKVKYLQNIKNYYEKNRIMSDIPNEWKKIWNNFGLINHFIEDCIEFSNKTVKANGLLDTSKEYEHIIFENGQGLLLSDRGVDIPGTTPSLTGCEYSKELLNEISSSNNISEVSIHYVTRPYLTRHGKGYIEGEGDRAHISSYISEDRTNHYNESQGTFRYGELDINSLKKRIELDSKKMNFLPKNVILDVTHSDEMDRIKEFEKEFSNVTVYDSPIIR